MEPNAPQTPEGALEALQKGYARYRAELEDSRATALSEVVGNLFRSQGNPRVNQLVSAFAPALEEWGAGLAGLLAGCTPEEADGYAAQALEQMLFYPRPADQSVEFSLQAFEGYAAPLLPFLAQDRRAETALRYQRRNPPRRMLPNQRKLWKALSGR